MQTFQPSNLSAQQDLSGYGSLIHPVRASIREEKARLEIGKKAAKTHPLVTAWMYSSVVTVPMAWVLSYKRNKSLGWAFLSGIIATPYIIYRGIEYGLYERKQ